MPKIVLFGATGYTGRLVAGALVAAGAAPLLAGRDQKRLDALAAGLGGLETAIADAARPESLRALLEQGDVLVSTVGPFALRGAAALCAAVQAGATYLDSAGEPSFIREVFEVEGPRAAGAGRAALVPAFGYDFVPGNLAGALALRTAGEQAVRIDVGYLLTGRLGLGSASSGTVASIGGLMLEPSFAWRGGRIVAERTAARVGSLPMRGRRRPAVSIGGTEHFALPRIAPSLREVNVYLGGFGQLAPAAPPSTGSTAPAPSARSTPSAWKPSKPASPPPASTAPPRSSAAWAALAVVGAWGEGAAAVVLGGQAVQLRPESLLGHLAQGHALLLVGEIGAGVAGGLQQLGGHAQADAGLGRRRLRLQPVQWVEGAEMPGLAATRSPPPVRDELQAATRRHRPGQQLIERVEPRCPPRLRGRLLRLLPLPVPAPLRLPLAFPRPRSRDGLQPAIVGFGCRPWQQLVKRVERAHSSWPCHRPHSLRRTRARQPGSRRPRSCQVRRCRPAPCGQAPRPPARSRGSPFA